MLQTQVEDAEVIEEWLSSRRKAEGAYPRSQERARKEKLVELALGKRQNGSGKGPGAHPAGGRTDHRRCPGGGRLAGAVWISVRMEAFDISNISGFESVGSMVVYEKGKPKRSDYRKFRIKSVQGPNDYASMEEVLTRRFTHESSGEFDSFAKAPDLLS